MGVFVVLTAKFVANVLLTFFVLTASFLLLTRLDDSGFAVVDDERKPVSPQFRHSLSRSSDESDGSTTADATHNKPKVILLLTELHKNRKWFFDNLDTNNEPNALKMCPTAEARNCVVTNDKRLLRTADAVVAHPRDHLDVRDVSRVDRLAPNQRLVFFSWESPLHTFADEFPAGITPQTFNDLRLFDHHFNWTMTYRKDSDIPMPYGRWFKRKTMGENSTIIFSSDQAWNSRGIPGNKTRPIAWIVSNCETASHRESYVEELRKHIDVDVYGRCGDKRCTCQRRQQSSDSGLELCPECYRDIESNYYFYLSFENSLCRHYVTEKAFVPLSRGAIVPIVLSSSSPQRFPDYRQEAPPHSVIDTADYPQGPKQLAAYLRHLMASLDDYRRYFDWRRGYVVEDLFSDLKWQSTAFCELCRKLNDDSQPAKSYSSLHQWWFGSVGSNLTVGHCET